MPSTSDTLASHMQVLGVIPARYGSTRFLGKPLALIGNKPMIQWVYERASQAKALSRLVVATDDDRIASAVSQFGGSSVMTDASLASGTDRVAVVMRQLGADIAVNIQGDEPAIVPEAIDAAVELVRSKKFEMASAMIPIKSLADLENPNIVKVICDSEQRAIYFSRFAIPHSRQKPKDIAACVSYQHVGLYVYTRACLERLHQLPPTALEQAEQLEQLRALQNGISIGMTRATYETIGVDTPEDLERAKKILLG